MTPEALHSTYLQSYSHFLQTHGKEPTHLLIKSYDFIKLSKHTLYTTFINNPNNTYDNLTIIFTLTGPPRVALL